MNDRRTYLCNSLATAWTEKRLFDFTVKIEDETFECHRLVLSMFSDFFAALFRSGMIEVHENSITLNDISPEVFKLIMEMIYTGVNLLTSENYIDVWRASHQLQISTLLHICEDFASTNITADTWEKLYTIAEYFQVESLQPNLHQFMLRNFNEVCISQTFLQLTFEDLRDLINSQDLVVSSEDLVMESVIRWVTYDPKVKNDKMDCKKETNEDVFTTEKSNRNAVLDKIDSRICFLSKLLKKMRIYLVSPLLLNRVRNMDLLAGSRDIIDDALSFSPKDFRHCLCPLAALTRSCSGYIHAGVIAKSDGSIKVINLFEEKYFHICDLYREIIHLVTHDGKLYALGQSLDREICVMYVFSEKKWKQVKHLPSHNLLLVSHEAFIYIIDTDDNTIYHMKPKTKRKYLNILTEFPENIFVKHAMFLQNVLLLFGNDQTGNNKTVIYKMEISSKVWIRLTNLDGPAKQMISFKNDKNDYILQTNGSLWLVLYSSDTGNIEFKFLAKLWNSTKRLYGALTFQSKLIIFGNNPNKDPIEEKKVIEVPDHFKCIRFLGTDDKKASNFVPITMRKTCLL